MEKRPDQDLERRPNHAGVPRHKPSDPDDFFGLDVDRMSPRAQVATGLTVLIPVIVGLVAVLTLLPNLWWLIFVFGWAVFPAFGLLVRGIAGLSEGRTELPSSGGDKERELLGALREHGELTPTRAAIETSLTVAEADEMLKGLAEGGHLEVKVRGGGLFYSLWGVDGGPEKDELEGPR